MNKILNLNFLIKFLSFVARHQVVAFDSVTHWHRLPQTIASAIIYRFIQMKMAGKKNKHSSYSIGLQRGLLQCVRHRRAHSLSVYDTMLLSFMYVRLHNAYFKDLLLDAQAHTHTHAKVDKYRCCMISYIKQTRMRAWSGGLEEFKQFPQKLSRSDNEKYISEVFVVCLCH